MAAPIVIDSIQLWRERLAVALIAFSVGLPCGLVIAGALAETLVIDPRMEAACKHPTREGEATVMLVIDGRMRCYRYN